MSNIGHDSSVLLDFLLLNETYFLLYFLRMLKYLNKRITEQHILPEVPFYKLNEVSVSIKKLTDTNLVPYDIKPVQRQLEKVIE